MSSVRPFILLLSLLLLAGTGVQASQLDQKLRKTEDLATQRRQSVLQLTAKEKALHGDLADLQDELNRLKQSVLHKEADLRGMEKRLRQARREHATLTEAQQDAYRELGRLIQALWPLRLSDMHGRQAGGEGWENSDRRFAWGSALYDDVHKALKDIETRAQSIRHNISTREALRARTQKQLADIHKDQDALLANRLGFVRRIREVRAERLNEEQALGQVLAAIEDLQYRKQADTNRRFESLKGSMPRPVKGKRIASSGLRSAGNRGAKLHGIAFRTAKQEPVKAVFWGKVVHSDTLRGYGRVVILSHGDDWYSLYAFLDQSYVSPGQEIEKGEPIGETGYCPAAKGPGLYFELRFGQKAINPLKWLASRG